MPSLDDLINNLNLPDVDDASLSANQQGAIDDLLKRRAEYSRQGRFDVAQACDDMIIAALKKHGSPPSENPFLDNIPGAGEPDPNPYLADIPAG